MSANFDFNANEHTRYMELCVLSSTEDLSRAERELVAQHAAICPECKLLLAYSQGPALENMALLAAIADPIKESTSSNWAPRHAGIKQKVLETFGPVGMPDQHMAVTTAVFSVNPSAFAMHKVMRYAGIAAVFVLGIAVVYEFGYKRGHDDVKDVKMIAPNPSIDSGVPKRLDTLEAERASVYQQLDARAATIDELTADIKEKEAKLAQVENLKDALGHDAEKLSSENRNQAATLLALTTQRDQLLRQLEESDKALKTEREQQQKATQNVIGLETEIGQIAAQLHDKEQTIAQQQALLAPDRDIRELMGARNLYIAEVYDISRAGQTQKAFGRVFFTQNKSLIFYAYDLDKQEFGSKNASTFQAWGKREGQDRKQAVNLGIFYVDSAANKRWALKVDDPIRLQQIDEVFVTVEPQGGSRKPSDKQLLFAYLRMDPNHP